MTKHLIAIVVVLLIWGCETNTSRAQDFVKKGRSELETGNEEKALYYFSEALKLDSCTTFALLNIGGINHDHGRYREAVEYQTKALRCDPDFGPALVNRAASLGELHQYGDALADVKKALELHFDTARAYLVRGHLEYRKHEYEKALDSFERAMKGGLEDQYRLECRVDIATVKFQMKRYDEVKMELETLLESEVPSNVRANIYNTLTMIAIEKKDFEKALSLVDKTIELDQKQPYPYNNRGFIYINLGKYDLAKADIDQSIMMDPYNAWAYRNKGLLELKKKNFPEAERLLLKAKQMDPTVEKIDEYLAMIPKKGK